MAKTSSHRRPVPVRIPPEMVERIDALRQVVRVPYAREISREAFVRYLLDAAISSEERKAARKEAKRSATDT